MNNEAQIEFFKKLITINTVNGNELAETNYIKKVLANHHISAQLIFFADGRTNLVAEVGNNPGPVLALAGHIDTVDTGDPANWTYDPFSATKENGEIYGRGTVDMQSGLAAMACTRIIPVPSWTSRLAERRESSPERFMLVITLRTSPTVTTTS